MKIVKKSDWQLEKRRTYLRHKLFSEKDLDQKGCVLQIVVFKPGQDILKHYHQGMTETYIVLEGSGVVTINDTELILEKCDVLLIEKGDWHAIKNDGDEDFIIAISKYNIDDTFLW